jgi:hypothetical protein
MKISLNSILTEAVIDSLNISKIDRAILKAFHLLRSEKNYSPSGNEFDFTIADKILKVDEMLNIGDYQKLYSLSKFYEKYSNFLYNDVPVLNDNVDLNFLEDREIIESIMYTYYYKNYKNKEIYNYRGNSWVLDTMMSPQEASLEETFALTIINNSEVYPTCVLFFDSLPNKKNNKIGVDFIIQDDEFAEFNGEKYKGGGYEEMIVNEWIDFNYPKDLKDETLRTYFDKLNNKVVNEIIKPNDFKFDEFLNYMNQQ